MFKSSSAKLQKVFIPDSVVGRSSGSSKGCLVCGVEVVFVGKELV